jgi:hypothetical protein
MAHYAFVNEENIVVEVITGRDETDLDNLPDGFSNWEEYYETRRTGLTCKRTSYNTAGNQHKLDGVAFRGNFAIAGGTYDEVNDVFIPPKLFDDWVLDETNWNWKAPIDYPNDGQRYVWDEETTSWELQTP